MASEATIREAASDLRGLIPPDDEQDALLRQAEAGGTVAFERLVWRYDEAILRLVLHLTSSEQQAIQLYRATFLKAYQRLALRDEPSLFIWLHRLAVSEWKQSRHRANHCPLSTDEFVVYTLKAGQGMALGSVAQILQVSEMRVATAFRRAVFKLQLKAALDL